METVRCSVLTASSMRVTCSLTKNCRASFLCWAITQKGEEARLQRCQNDVETNACCQVHRISHERGVCTAGGSRENEFRVTVPGNHHIADWTSVVCVALGIPACLVLVAFHVGGRYSGKNHERSENPQRNLGDCVEVQRKFTKQ